MGFKKGVAANPNGRPTDPNIKILRDAMRSKLHERVDVLFEQLDKLTGRYYVEYFMRIHKEVMPAMPSEPIEEGPQKKDTIEEIKEILKNRGKN